MRIAILGTGMVGRALAGALHRIGNDVVLGTRDPAATLARGGEGGFGPWAQANPQLQVAAFADAADGADLVVDALPGAVAEVGIAAAQVAPGTVLLDVSNPLEPGRDGPPVLFVANTDSLAERLQRAFPYLRVVKSLNTMTAPLMVNPAKLAGGDFSTFLCGDDAAAKEVVGTLLADLGHRDVIDLGGLSAARGMEAMMLLWLRLWGLFGTAEFNYKIVR